MSAKRRQSIKREGSRNFAPDCEPDYRYGGKTLTNDYDKRCYEEGWYSAKEDYEYEPHEEADDVQLF